MVKNQFTMVFCDVDSSLPRFMAAPRESTTFWPCDDKSKKHTTANHCKCVNFPASEGIYTHSGILVPFFTLQELCWPSPWEISPTYGREARRNNYVEGTVLELASSKCMSMQDSFAKAYSDGTFTQFGYITIFYWLYAWGVRPYICYTGMCR